MSRWMLTAVARLAALSVVIAISGCASLAPNCASPARMMVSAEVIFGRDIRDGAEVSEAAFADFVAHDIAPRFADGFTMIDGHGQWRDDLGRNVRERSKFMIVTFDDGPQRRSDLAAITDRYKRRFHQQSVLTQIRNVCVSF